MKENGLLTGILFGLAALSLGQALQNNGGFMSAEGMVLLDHRPDIFRFGCTLNENIYAAGYTQSAHIRSIYWSRLANNSIIDQASLLFSSLIRLVNYGHSKQWWV